MFESLGQVLVETQVMEKGDLQTVGSFSDWGSIGDYRNRIVADCRTNQILHFHGHVYATLIGRAAVLLLKKLVTRSEDKDGRENLQSTR
jgi:hypothetical protein